MDVKVCSKCARSWPLSEFSGGSRSSNVCRLCRNECSRRYRSTHKEQLRAYRHKKYASQVELECAAARSNYALHVEERQEEAREHRRQLGETYLAAARARHKERHVARMASQKVTRAIADGTLVQGTCWCAAFSLGATCMGSLEAHHEDYSQPLVVIWLCRSHHRKLHARRKARARRAAKLTPSTD